MSRKLSSRSCKKASDEADRVVAATAGRENWQTWAGRKHGTEDFEYLDVFRGMKRTFNDRFRSKVPVAGTTCPVCFCEPDDPSMWYVTWCGHGICKDCLAQYAASQVGDQEQSGPLTCPVCLKTLRERDAFAALTAGDNRNELIEKWDLKTRNQLLRAIPSFRTCPKCGGSDSIGGGFVTPDCLAPQHDERRQAATQILMNRNVESAHLADEETSKWLKANTRPCPSCSVPINKRDGCNHMTCTHCRVKFCWACMRLQTNCRAYNCGNGAPYGNASPTRDQFGQVALQNGGPVMAYIDHILNNRVCPDLHPSDGLLILVCLFGRHLTLVQHLEDKITPIITRVIQMIVFSTPTLFAILFMRDNIVEIVTRVVGQRIARQGNPEGRRPHPIRGNAIEALDQAMLNAVLQRSIRET
eukprot:jgi/Psemu1/321830/estExt_fgenesh1_pg.C_110046